MYCRTTAIPSVCGRQKCILQPPAGVQTSDPNSAPDGEGRWEGTSPRDLTMAMQHEHHGFSQAKKTNISQWQLPLFNGTEKSCSFPFSISMWNKPRVWSNYLFQVQDWWNLRSGLSCRHVRPCLANTQPTSLAVHSARKQSMIHKENLGSKLTWKNT